MAGKVTRWAVARFHAVVPVETLRTHFVAPITHPAGIAYALAIILPALGLVLAVALLIAVNAVETSGTDFFAVGTGPSRRTLAGSCFVRAFSSVLTGASMSTLVAISSRRTRMFTGSSNVARSARVLSGYVIACRISIRTPLLTSMSEESIRTRVVTRGTSPATRTNTITGDWITGRIVVAGAYFVARFSVVA